MPRLDIERQHKLEPRRMEKAMNMLKDMGYNPVQVGDARINFTHFKGSNITFYPYSGWHSGKDIEDGRGLEHLLKQLRHAQNPN